ncbi:hypothetical protein GTS_50470 [Gandjariella thermophila]|uniref:Uncharacterized protein n=1 Tax=Gandjariella thermophila TaxID=1931992 RepID=A0A4D4JCR2_9PSEU|nr:hypothetical protein GTS_50470 [Gandjariella thermophila]
MTRVSQPALIDHLRAKESYVPRLPVVIRCLLDQAVILGAGSAPLGIAQDRKNVYRLGQKATGAFVHATWMSRDDTTEQLEKKDASYNLCTGCAHRGRCGRRVGVAAGHRQCRGDYRDL